MSSNQHQQTTPAGGAIGHASSVHGTAPKKKKSNSATTQFIWVIAIIVLFIALMNLSNISGGNSQNPTVEQNSPAVSDHNNSNFKATSLIDDLVKQTGSTTLTVTEEGIWVSVIGKMNVYTPSEVIFDDGAGHTYTLKGNKFGDNKPSPDVQRWLIKSTNNKTATITFTKN